MSIIVIASIDAPTMYFVYDQSVIAHQLGESMKEFGFSPVFTGTYSHSIAKGSVSSPYPPAEDVSREGRASGAVARACRDLARVSDILVAIDHAAPCTDIHHNSVMFIFKELSPIHVTGIAWSKKILVANKNSYEKVNKILQVIQSEVVQPRTPVLVSLPPVSRLGKGSDDVIKMREEIGTDRIILSVARPGYSRFSEEIIGAVRLVREYGYDVGLILAEPGTSPEKWIRSTLRFADATTLHDLISISDAVIVNSKRGASMIPLEAHAYGVPTIGLNTVYPEVDVVVEDLRVRLLASAIRDTLEKKYTIKERSGSWTELARVIVGE